MAKDYRLQLMEMEQGKSMETLVTEGFAAGKNLWQIAQDLHVPYTTLYNWTRKRGMKVERRVTFAPIDELTPA